MEDYKSEKSILDHLARLNINPKILENPTAKTIILGIIGNRINSLLAANSGTNEIENMYNNDIYVDFNGNVIHGTNIDGSTKKITGNFVILRSSSKDNFHTWQEVRRFRLSNEIPYQRIFYDYTVE